MISQAQMQASIAELESNYPDLAETHIPAGITRLLLLALAPPKKVWRDTKYSSAKELPLKISVRDDLVLIKNLLDYQELDQLLDSTLNLSRIPGDIEALRSLNLADALEQVTQGITDRNLPFTATLETRGNKAKLALNSHVGLGVFGHIFELLASVIIFRLMMSFLEFSENKLDALGSITLNYRCPEGAPMPKLIRLGAIVLRRSKFGSSITFPTMLLQTRNPSSDLGPDLKVTTGRGRSGMHPKAHFGLDVLNDLVRQTIRDQARAPQLDEIAKHFGVSDRTVLRNLSHSGRTLRQLVIDQRMQLAMELLSDPSSKISEVSGAAGYGDPSSFVRAFRARFGQSPHQWRKNSTA